MKLIVNADDFGLREGVTNAIDYCFREHLITQTTAMVNMPYFEPSVEVAKQHGYFDRIGLHLNLTFGKPLTEAILGCPRFCNGNGEFNGRFHVSRMGRLHLSSKERVAVISEADAQMKKFASFGFHLMHLDSHHHSHTDPAILNLVVPLARRWGFRTMRLSRNMGGKMTTLKRVYKAYVNRKIKANFTHSDYFGDFAACVQMVEREHSDEVFEVMTHPVYWIHGDFETYVPFGELYDLYTPFDEVRRIHEQLIGRVELATYAAMFGE